MFTSPLRRHLALRHSPRQFQLAAARQFQSSSRQSLADKKDEGRDDLNPVSTEYSKSAGDSASARATDEAAFSPDKTRPEEQERHAESEAEGRGDINNPLNVSPANQEVSQPRSEQEGGSQGSPAEDGQGRSQRSGGSGGGSPNKAGGGKSGGGGAL